MKTHKEEIKILLNTLNSFSQSVYDNFGLPSSCDICVDHQTQVLESFLEKIAVQTQSRTIEIDCYEVYTTNDYTEEHYAYVASVEIAKELCANTFSRRYAEFKKKFDICYSIEEVEENDRTKKLQRILVKLTLEEQKFLGLV